MTDGPDGWVEIRNLALLRLSDDVKPFSPSILAIADAGADALIAAGYRQVPSVEKLGNLLHEVLGIEILPTSWVIELRNRLLEGDREKEGEKPWECQPSPPSLR